MPGLDELLGPAALEPPQASWRGPVLVIGGIAIGVGIFFWRARSASAPTPVPAPVPPVAAPPAAAPPQPQQKDDNATDPETALARMLASEDSRRAIRILVGWVTLQRAKGRDLYNFITSGKGYGLQKRDGFVVYAGTSQKPTAETRELAAQLLAGTLQPSAKIRSVKVGSWAQRKQTQGGVKVTDERLIELQKVWDEGIWAQVAIGGKPTGWLLYSKGKPFVKAAAGKSAAEALDQVPLVEALD